MALYGDSNLVNICLLWGFNNYFDRKIIHYDRPLAIIYDDRAPYVRDASGYEYKSEINFNPADGINAELVVSFDEGGNISNGLPNYLITYYTTKTPAPGGMWFYTYTVVTRWFITDAVRLRGYQYRLILRRDVIADHYDDVVNMPAYVLKANLPESDIRIVNDEGLNLNKIKINEIEIPEAFKQGTAPRTGWARTNWIVGYMENSTSGKITGRARTAPAEYYTYSDIANAMGGLVTAGDIINAVNGSINFISQIPPIFGFRIRRTSQIFYRSCDFFGVGLDITSIKAATAYGYGYNMTPLGEVSSIDDSIASLQTYLNTQTADDFMQGVNDSNSLGLKMFLNSQQIILENFNGKYLIDGGNYYKIKITPLASNIQVTENVSRASSTLLSNTTSALGITDLDPQGIGEYSLSFVYNSFMITLEQFDGTAIEVDIPATHNVLSDAPYSMFMIPVNKISLAKSPVVDVTTVTGDDILEFASNIAEQLGSKLIDMQLLPYFAGTPKLASNSVDNINATWIYFTGSGDIASVMFFPTVSTFKKILYGNDFDYETGENIYAPILKANDLKLESQTDLYRVVSPNYAGAFEFNLAKNGGFIEYWVIDCTYKPFNPYIKIAPQFSGLYGTNYNDQRGLVCGGDFSLPIMTDQWINYQINNKNYATVFARDIQNLDFKQAQEERLNGLNMITGAGVGTIGGAVAGGKLGGPYGAIAGAVVGAAGSTIGGAMDLEMARERRAEERDYIIDRFNLNLANIRALPDTLAKNSSINANTRPFPIIEKYTCTETEKQALINKIKYDGMTVNSIGRIIDFQGINNQFTLGTYTDADNTTTKYLNYFKGQLIMGVNNESAENIAEDTHYLNALYEELLKGVYI